MGATEKISQTKNNAYNPIAVIDSSDNIHVAWSEATPEGSLLYYCVISGTKRNISVPLLVTNTINGYLFGFSLAVNANGEPHFVWIRKTPINQLSSDYSIYYKHLCKTTWIENKFSPLQKNGLRLDHPAIVIDRLNNAHIVWQTYDAIFYNKFDGKGWLAEPVIIHQVERKRIISGYVYILKDREDKLQVYWTEQERESKVYGTAFLNYAEYDGKNWEKRLNLLNITAYRGGSINLILDHSDNLHLIWLSEHEKNEVVMYSIKKKEDDKFSEPVIITRGISGFARYNYGECKIIIDSESNPYVLLSRPTCCGQGTLFVYYYMKNNKWIGPFEITEGLGIGGFNLVIDSNNNLFAVWSYAGLFTNFKIYYSCLRKSR